MNAIMLLGTLKPAGLSIVVFATPVWWDNASSLIQRVIERLDELHDDVLAGRPSGLEGKAGGIVITGDSDGAQHIANIANFFNAVGSCCANTSRRTRKRPPA